MTASLADFPGMGRRIEHLGLRYQITRRYKYRVVYRDAGDELEILQIYHPRQVPREP